MKNTEPIIQLTRVHQEYQSPAGRAVEAVQNINLAIHAGKFVSVVGPSGCGKSTIIKLIAGLTAPSSGEVLVSGQNAKKQNTRRGVMLQQCNLFPWLTVKENILFGLQAGGFSVEEQVAIYKHYIKIIGLDGFEDAYPKELSGGMQQRVSLARTLATNPDVLLMDEPLSALDSQTRRAMRQLVIDVWSREPRTALLVTHDIDEAILLSDVVYVLSPRPGTIIKKIDIPFVRPRPPSLEYTSEFSQLKQEIQATLSTNIIK